MIVGVDEAGRGPLAGPVVGCALYLANKPSFPVKDSKETSSSRREEIFPWIIKNSIFSVNIASSVEIDKYNILGATFLAFNRAIKNLLIKAPHLKRATFIIDGNIFRTHLKLDYICLEKADKKVKEVSCASIVAKVTRDYLMGLVGFLYPQWNFSGHKGYPTREHFSLIKENLLTPLHRRTFSPCQIP
ncbi:MAG: ribonuclease HII [Candidatus Omnitrophica bacterium]|nr:ribonuclease HII [Candidatus Omnitrophota bacterium]